MSDQLALDLTTTWREEKAAEAVARRLRVDRQRRIMGLDRCQACDARATVFVFPGTALGLAEGGYCGRCIQEAREAARKEVATS